MYDVMQTQNNMGSDRASKLLITGYACCMERRAEPLGRKLREP